MLPPQWGPGRNTGLKRILVYFELENRAWRQHFFTNALRKNSFIGKKCRNDVSAFIKLAERRNGAFRLNFSAQ